MPDDKIHQRFHTVSLMVRIKHCVTILGRTVCNRKVQDLIRGIKLCKQVKDLIHRPVTSCSRFIDLVYNNDNGQAVCQGLFEHEISLGHGPLLCIHKQKSAVCHTQDSLHLAAEIRMPRRINNIYQMVSEQKRAVF